jgi:hypothetical protein
MVDEATVAVGSAEMVVLPAGLTSAGWKRVARERLVIEAMVLVVAVGSEERVRVGSSGNVARLRSLKSVAQAASILLASEDGIGWFLMSRVAWILRSKLMWRHGLPFRRVWGGVRLLTNDPEWSVWWHCCGNLDCVKVCDWVV